MGKNTQQKTRKIVRKKHTKQPQFSLVSRFVVALVLTVVIGGFILTMPKPEVIKPEKVLAKREFSMEKRYGNEFVNGVFKDNILLNAVYIGGKMKVSASPDWKAVQKPFTGSIVLAPNETFAYHKDVLPEYKGKPVKALDLHFGADQGFKSDGYLMGDGVCHLASLINWAARDAKLDVVSPTNHDFANIAQVPREYGVAIYSMPGNEAGNAQQNLYVTNTTKKPIALKFSFDGKNLAVAVVEQI